MGEGEDKREPDLNLCDTPACHGGWADLRDWADRNPEYWGNEHGETMFTCKKAFGKTEQEALSLKEIPDWYMNVSKRLRGEEEKLYVL